MFENLNRFGLIVLVAGTALLQLACRNSTILNKESPVVNNIGLGQNFRVLLPDDHRQGYTWQLTNTSLNGCVEETSSVWHGNEKGIEFNFKSLASCQTTLTFVCRKYIDTLNVKSFIVKIQ